jgi:hypothetical protein
MNKNNKHPRGSECDEGYGCECDKDFCTDCGILTDTLISHLSEDGKYIIDENDKLCVNCAIKKGMPKDFYFKK